MKQTATIAISQLSNPKHPEETNLPAIYCHNNLSGRQRTFRMTYHVIAISQLNYCHLCPVFFFQTSFCINAVFLVAISVLHREQYTSHPQMLNSYQDSLPQVVEISTSKELNLQSNRCTVYPLIKQV